MSKTVMIKEYDPLNTSTILIQDSKYPSILEVKNINIHNDKAKEISLGFVSFYQIEQLAKSNK